MDCKIFSCLEISTLNNNKTFNIYFPWRCHSMMAAGKENKKMCHRYFFYPAHFCVASKSVGMQCTHRIWCCWSRRQRNSIDIFIILIKENYCAWFHRRVHWPMKKWYLRFTNYKQPQFQKENVVSPILLYSVEHWQGITQRTATKFHVWINVLWNK